LLKQELIIALTNSELRADIPIPTSRTIIAIEGERTRTTAIKRVTADTKHAPPAADHLMICPFIILSP
jgi:hypothetical protein